VQRVARQVGGRGEDLGIGEIDAEDMALRVWSGPEQKRPLAAQTQPERGQVSRPIMIETLTCFPGDVSEGVEDRERLALLEEPRLGIVTIG